MTVAVTPGGSGVVFDVWAPQGQLRFVLDDAHAMELRGDVPMMGRAAPAVPAVHTSLFQLRQPRLLGCTPRSSR